MEMPVLKVPLNPNQPSHGNAPAWRGYSVNTAVLSKERLSIDETTIQDLRLVKQANQLHGGCTDVPVIYQVINAVWRAHSKYVRYLDSEKQIAAQEAERRKVAEQTAEAIENLVSLDIVSSKYINLLFTENNGSDRQRKQIWTTNDKQ